jgi:MerR, DNA binding
MRSACACHCRASLHYVDDVNGAPQQPGPPPRCACTGGLRFIRRARELGFGIEDIRALLALSARELAFCAQARDIAAARLADVRAKRDDLAKLETILADTIAQCDAQCGSGVTPACPVLEVLQA